VKGENLRRTWEDVHQGGGGNSFPAQTERRKSREKNSGVRNNRTKGFAGGDFAKLKRERKGGKKRKVEGELEETDSFKETVRVLVIT